ncbi:glycerophosphodiester phosphodiesterase [Pseudonocardia sp. P1]
MRVVPDTDATVPDRTPTTAGARPVVIAHRGASGNRPEHTLAAYELAARVGADYLETDVVPTRDGHLVCRHEPGIGGTTDVAARPEFAGRRTRRTIDGEVHEGWFTHDFTLAELRTLRAVERLPGERPGNRVYDARFAVPTLAELLDLRERLSRELGREIGVYPEIKHSTHHAGIGLPAEPLLVDALDGAGLNRPDAPVYVQSFEVTNLRWLRGRLRVPLVQLTDVTGGPADLPDRSWTSITSPDGLREVATYADAVGPAKAQVVPAGPDGALGPPSSLVADAHAAGLLVHPYTFRNENAFLPPALRSGGPASAWGDVFAEYDAFLDAGVDGLFSDHPDTALAALSFRRGGRGSSAPDGPRSAH